MSDPSNLYLLTEAAVRTGLTVDALRKRIRRGSLETIKGNDGLVRVRLTTADVDSLRLAEGQPTPSAVEENGQTIKTLEAAAAALHERAARAEAEAAALRERADKAEARAGQVEAEREAARAEAARERDRAENALIRGATAEGKAEGLRLALEEARRLFWRRWIG